MSAAHARNRSQADPHWTLAACVLASSLSFVDGSVLSVALPAIRASYQADAADVQWVVNAYLLPLSALLLLGGALGDHYGRRRLLLIGTSLFTAASLVCALAPSLDLLLAARAAQGVGAAFFLPSSLALLNAAYEGEQRGRAVGIWAAAGAAAAAIAPLIGGWLVENVGWPSIFIINLPLAAGAILLAVTFVTESKDDGAGRSDYSGALLAILGLGGATYGLTRWSSSAALDPIAIATIVGGFAMLAAFLWVEARSGDQAMMPLAMFADRCFSGLNLLTFLLYGAFGVAMLLIPYVLISAGGYSPVEAGMAMLPLPILLTIASPPIGQLAARIGPRWLLTAGPLVVAAGMLLARRIDAGSSYWTTVFPAMMVIAAGMALAVAPLTSSVLGSVNERHVGTASGFNSAVARTGGLIATALLGIVLSREGDGLIAGFHLSLIGAAIAAAAASAAAMLLIGNVRMKNG